MPEFTLPAGFYISISGAVRARFGGQTRAVLLRNRYFTQFAGVETTLITLDQQPVYPLERERLTERGELVPGMRLLNIFESYRNEDLVTGPPIADALPDLSHMDTADKPHPDGTIHYTAYREPETETDIVRDYRRADGSVYVRTPGPDVVEAPGADHAGRPAEPGGAQLAEPRRLESPLASLAGR